MSRKWYQKATVQSQLVSGIVSISSVCFGAAITFVMTYYFDNIEDRNAYIENELKLRSNELRIINSLRNDIDLYVLPVTKEQAQISLDNYNRHIDLSKYYDFMAVKRLLEEYGSDRNMEKFKDALTESSKASRQVKEFIISCMQTPPRTGEELNQVSYKYVRLVNEMTSQDSVEKTFIDGLSPGIIDK